MFCYLGEMLSVDGDADAVEARVHKGCNKFRQLVPLLTNKENKLTLRRTQMRMIRWMCGVTVTDRFLS